MVAAVTMENDAVGLISTTNKGTVKGKRADLLKHTAQQKQGARQRESMHPAHTRRTSAASSLWSDCSLDIDSRVPSVSPIMGLFGPMKDDQSSGTRRMLPRLATSRKMQRWKPPRQRPCTPFEGTAVCGIAGADVFRHAVIEVPQPALMSRAHPSSAIDAEAKVATLWPMPRRLGPADGQKLGNLARRSSVSRTKQHTSDWASPQILPRKPAHLKARSPLSLGAFPRSRFGELRRLQSSPSLVASMSQQASSLSKIPRVAAAWDGSKS